MLNKLNFTYFNYDYFNILKGAANGSIFGLLFSSTCTLLNLSKNFYYVNRQH